MKTHFPLLLAFATIAVPFSAHAAEYTVNSTTDAPVTAADATTSGTLRQMITNANASTVDDTIVFAPGVSGTISLTAASGGTLAVNSATSGALSITGPVATTSALGIAISGSNAVRVIQNFGNLTLNNLTIRDGNVTSANGAGVLNLNADGTAGTNLTVDKCTFTNNKATAGPPPGGGTNTGGIGGAIYVGVANVLTGGLTITNSTLSNNSGSSRGGAIANVRSTVLIQNCTITGNSASNGGGVSTSNSQGNTTIGNSIIVGNTTNDAQVTAGAAVYVSQGYNLIGFSASAASFTQTGDVTGVTAAQAKLDALADNGGPTQTIALVSGSVAIDTGATALTVDQRGTARPQGAAADIGAYEGSIANRAPRLNNATYTSSVSSAFSQQLAGTDADPGDTLAYALATGSALPAGLTLDSATGIISGTPTTAGRTDFSVTVTDGITPAITAKFIIIISAAGADGVGPVMTRTALNPSYTRAQLAALLYTGTVKDVAQDTVTPVGVKQVLFQLRQGATAYSGNEGTGFTSNLNLGYFPAFLGAPVPADTTGTSTFRRNFASFIPSTLAAGSYSIVILGQDNLNNFSVEVVPVTITAPAAQAAKSAFGVSGSANGS